MKIEFSTQGQRLFTGTLMRSINYLSPNDFPVYGPELIVTLPGNHNEQVNWRMLIAIWPDSSRREIRIMFHKKMNGHWVATELLDSKNGENLQHYTLIGRDFYLDYATLSITDVSCDFSTHWQLPSYENQPLYQFLATPADHIAKTLLISSPELEFEVTSRKLAPHFTLWSMPIDDVLTLMKDTWSDETIQSLKEASNDFLNLDKWREAAKSARKIINVTKFSGQYSDTIQDLPINDLIMTIFPTSFPGDDVELTHQGIMEKLRENPVWQVSYRNFSTPRSLRISEKSSMKGLQGDILLAQYNKEEIDRIFAIPGNVNWAELARLTGKTLHLYNGHGGCEGVTDRIVYPNGKIEYPLKDK